MGKFLLPLISFILALLFLISLVVFSVFPLNNIDIRNHTVQTTVENIHYVNKPYSSTQTGLELYTSQDFDLPYRAIFVGLTVEFDYSNLNTSMDFFNRKAKTSAYIIYDITSQLDSTTLNIIFDNYDRRFYYMENYLFNADITLNMDYFYKGYLLPVHFMNNLLTNVNFDFYNYFLINNELPNLTSVKYFPISGLLSIERNSSNVPYLQFSYSVPLNGWGYAGIDVGTRSYMGNVVTVFDFSLFNLNSLFNITNLNDVDSINDLLELVKDVVLFPIHIVEIGYTFVTALTFNLVFI